MPIFSELLKPALDSVTGLVSEFHMSPEDKAKFAQAAADAAAKAQQASVDYDAKLNDIAGQNIRADSTSGDKYTERARPSFMYLVMAVLAFNYIGLPCAQVFGSHVEPIALPADLLALFGVCVTGYSFMRTAEKVAGLPGDSQMSVLGMKVGNKQ
jgi:Holin of 3TMs, for gene-transfer release